MKQFLAKKKKAPDGFFKFSYFCDSEQLKNKFSLESQG